jgi:hypothetical protein
VNDEAFYVVTKPKSSRRVTRRGEAERLLPDCLFPRFNLGNKIGMYYWICFTARAKGPLFIWDRTVHGNQVTNKISFLFSHTLASGVSEVGVLKQHGVGERVGELGADFSPLCQGSRFFLSSRKEIKNVEFP